VEQRNRKKGGNQKPLSGQSSRKKRYARMDVPTWSTRHELKRSEDLARAKKNVLRADEIDGGIEKAIAVPSLLLRLCGVTRLVLHGLVGRGGGGEKKEAS